MMKDITAKLKELKRNRDGEAHITIYDDGSFVIEYNDVIAGEHTEVVDWGRNEHEFMVWLKKE